MDEIKFARWVDRAEASARELNGAYNFVSFAAPTMTVTQVEIAQQELDRRLGDQATKALVIRSAVFR
jgi:hypothetical protein